MHAQAKLFPGETGGIVVGRGKGRLDALIPSGPGAKRTNSSWQLDAEYLQPRLEAAERLGLELTALWHVHPEGVAKLSGTDLAAANRILRDKDWGIDTLILPLTTRRGESFETRVFVVDAPGAVPRHVPLVVTSELPNVGNLKSTTAANDDAPTTLASGNVTSVGTCGAEHPSKPAAMCAVDWCTSAPPPARSSANERIARDIEALEGHGWSVAMAATRQSALITLRRGAALVVVELPVEYPASPPSFSAATVNGMVDFRGVPETRDWSSLRSLLAAVEETCAAAERVKPVPRAGFLSRVFRRTRGEAAIARTLTEVRHGA